MTRRYELDWLRVIAFMVLIYFHAAVFFIPTGLPLIQNPETSEELLLFVQVSSQFRLALLFFISGVGVYFARRRRNPREFIAERSQRLLIPFAFGLAFLVPPMVYTEKVFLGDFSGSLAAFYTRLFSEGLYPEGNLSWHHFWFIAYLYLFCLLGIPVFNRIDGMSAKAAGRLQRWCAGYGIYWLIPVLLVPEVLLRHQFPGFRDLVHDWASFTLWFIVFLTGYLLAGRMALVDDVVRLRHVSFTLALASTGLIFAVFGATSPDLSDWPNREAWYLLWCALRMVMVWSCILTCLGFAGRYLKFGGRVLSYLNEAVYPLFILHLTTLVVLGYFIVQSDWSLWTRYWVLTTATIGIILVFYHLCIRPFNTMRLLFGVKPRVVTGERAAALPGLE